MTAVQIDATTWRVSVAAADGTETHHLVACRAADSSAASALAIIAALSLPEPAPDAAALLAAERAGMSCSRMQGVLALGPGIWAQVLAWRDLPQTPWAARVIIDDAAIWHRNSQTIDLLGYVCGLSPEAMDTLFRQAVTITA